MYLSPPARPPTSTGRIVFLSLNRSEMMIRPYVFAVLTKSSARFLRFQCMSAIRSRSSSLESKVWHSAIDVMASWNWLVHDGITPVSNEDLVPLAFIRRRSEREPCAPRDLELPAPTYMEPRLSVTPIPTFATRRPSSPTTHSTSSSVYASTAFASPLAGDFRFRDAIFSRRAPPTLFSSLSRGGGVLPTLADLGGPPATYPSGASAASRAGSALGGPSVSLPDAHKPPGVP
mmetsp:Transcript_34661/g.97741  ORF Transcript_34661/g.97741 Transcript_34661/m.97741 type:complete len:232 (+) Transcript_34661:1138-1833(+)